MLQQTIRNLFEFFFSYPLKPKILSLGRNVAN